MDVQYKSVVSAEVAQILEKYKVITVNFEVQ